MTNLLRIYSQLQQLRRGKPGRWVVLFGEQPEPTRRLPGDVIIHCREKDRYL